MTECIPGSKKCKTCRKCQPLARYPRKTYKSGKIHYEPICYDCRQMRRRESRRQNIGAVRAKEKDLRARSKKRLALNNKNWRLRNRERLLAKEAEYRQKNREKIRSRSAIKARQYYHEDPEAFILRAQNYRADRLIRVNSEDRIPRKRNDVTKNQLDDLLEKQTYRCAICKTGIKRKRHLDHIVPITKGGLHEMKNLQFLCAFCNISKGAKDPIVYMQWRGFLL